MAKQVNKNGSQEEPRSKKAKDNNEQDAHGLFSISQPFILRPVMTTLIVVGIVLFGTIGYFLLPVNDLPSVDYPTISVSASLPGANPEAMASAVATPLEKQFSTIAGLDSMNSTSGQGSTSITMQFSLDREIDAAAQDVQTAISAALVQLPTNMPNPPSIRKVNPADAPILYLTLSSPILPLYDVDEYAETLVAQRISTVSGVAQVQVYGAQKYAVRTQLNPIAMNARGIGIDEVIAAIRRENPNLPVGTLYGKHQNLTIKVNGQMKRAYEYQNLIITYKNGAPVRLKDLGDSLDSVENNKVAASLNGQQRTIMLAIQRQPGTNTIAVVDAIKALTPSFKAQLPASVDLNVMYDRSITIRNSVNDVQFTLLLAVALVVMVIFLFLRNGRATIIPSLALPASLIGTFGVMYLLGFSINNLSLMAMTLSVGFVVDDAIVMLENIVRRMEAGDSVLEASLKGSREIGFTILSMTISLVAVFIPILFMAGILGRLFKEFAITISVAIVFSGFISLTLTPMLCNKFLVNKHPSEHGKLYNFLEHGFNKILNEYERLLKIAIKHSWITLVISVVLVFLTIYMFGVVPKGFVPSDDRGQIIGSVEGLQGSSFNDMVQHQQVISEILRSDPNVAQFSSSAGAGGRNSSISSGSIFITLKPLSERKLSSEQVIEELRPKLARVPGVRVYLQNPPAFPIGGQSTRSLYQLTLRGADIPELFENATLFEQKLHTLPMLQDISGELQAKNPQINIVIDRQKSSSLGVTSEQIQSAFNFAYGSSQVSTIYMATNEYQVIAELKPEFQTNPGDLSNLYIHSSTGKLIPLSSVATIQKSLGPLTITHLGQLPSVTISFNLKPNVSLSEATAAVQQLAATTLPGTISVSFQGTAKVFEASLNGLGWLLIIAILVIYLVLGMLYESFIHPLTILSGLPSAGLGALLTLMLFNKPLDIYAFVGLIMLVGIVKKNAIMMIDFALEAQRAGKAAKDAIYEACIVRFRPIMMTTMAALMGALPIALGIGAGAQSRQSLGLAVVGGLIVSQTLTLFLTPIIYIFFERVKSKFNMSLKPVGFKSPELEKGIGD